VRYGRFDITDLLTPSMVHVVDTQITSCCFRYSDIVEDDKRAFKTYDK